MKPINIGGHSAYQNRVLTQLRKYYPDAANSLSSSTWQILDKFWNLDLSAVDTLMQDRYSPFGPEPRLPPDMKPCLRLWEMFNTFFLQVSARKELISLKKLALAGDGTPVYTSAKERKTRICKCLENGLHDCKCNRIYHQPDCDIGWDSHRNCFYFGYGLYMLTASDSVNDLPVFPFLSPASRHDSHGFLYNWFSMKQMLPQANVTKLILDSAHDAMPYYEYCKAHGITPFIDLNWKCGRNVHLVLDDNPRLINHPPRGSKEWKLAFNARTSAERYNKRQKIDYKLEDGRYRSSMMWYCHLFAIMMCQHLDAWDLPKTSPLKDLFEQAA